MLRRVFRAWWIGRQIEAGGNRVAIGDLVFSVDNLTIGVRMKSTLFDGSYERPELELSEHFLLRELPVIELGGAIGVVSCFTNRCLSHPQRHVVIEANSALVQTLSLNRD